MGYLTAAYTIIWLVMAIFMFTSGRKISRLEGEILRLEGIAKRMDGRD